MVDQTGPAEKVSLIGSWQGPVVYRCHPDKSARIGVGDKSQSNVWCPSCEKLPFDENSQMRPISHLT